MEESSFVKISIEHLINDRKTLFSDFEKLMDVVLSLYLKRVENKTDFYTNERLYHINLLTQKFMLHGFSMKKLINGITLDSPSNNIKVPILDPFSVYTLTRSMIETYLVQNYLSNNSYDSDLLDGRFEIWMRYGLLKRGKDFESEEAKKIIELDMKSIEQLERSLRQRKFYNDLIDSKKTSFWKTIDAEWKLIFEKEKFFPVSWKRLLEDAGIEPVICNNTYNFLSWHAHSQSISVLQLKDMWENNHDKEAIKISIKEINMFIAFMISDIILSEDNFKIAYNSLNQELKDIVNFYSLSYRNSKYAIEKVI